MKRFEIRKLKGLTKSLNSIVALDLETIDIGGIQRVICITYAYKNTLGDLISDFISVNDSMSMDDYDERNLWIELFERLKVLDISNKFICYFHNLGNFDGYFLYDAIIKIFPKDNIKSLISRDNEFIEIKLRLGDKNFIFRDSLRILKLSLKDLCDVWEVEGKYMEYNPDFNSITVLKNKDLYPLFKNYAIQDSVCLLNILEKAQMYYYKHFNIDMSEAYSMTSLGMLIFRTHFLGDRVIKLPSKSLDYQIRKAYYGGATDHYIKECENVYYYDINSLYPSAMINTMPNELINSYDYDKKGKNNWRNIFGFALCYIECPKNISIPLLPFRSNTISEDLIYPTGSWVSTYFIEELKAVEKYGYTVKPLRIYEFSKIDLFKEYVEYFYELKRKSKGADKYVYKNLLNHMYGYWGKSLEQNTTLLVDEIKLNSIMMQHSIGSLMEHDGIEGKVYTILLNTNIDRKIMKELSSKIEKNIIPTQINVASHVGIAAAITSYARIAMMPYKNIQDNSPIYTDTDSVFLKKPLSSELVSDKLGAMKDEMNGKVIQRMIVLGNKKYCYEYIKDEEVKTISVFAGIPRNKLTFNDFVELDNGKTLNVKTYNHFKKSFRDLSIRIFDRNISLTLNRTKNCINNKYIPIHLKYTRGDYSKYIWDIISIKTNKFFNKFKALVLRKNKSVKL